MKLKKFLVLLLIPFLYACSSDRSSNYDDAFAKDTNGLDLLTGQFSQNIDQIWGVNELLVGPSGPTPESATPEDADSTPRTPTDNESRTISA